MYGNFSGHGTRCLSAQIFEAAMAIGDKDRQERINTQIELNKKSMEETEAMIRRILKDNPDAKINININI